MKTLSAFGLLLRDLIWLTIVDPVRTGRPRVAKWPTGLAPIFFGTLAVYVVMAALVVFAGPIRAAGTLVVTSQGATLPEVATWLCIAAAFLALVLQQTAALHLPWWVKLLSLLLTGTQVMSATVLVLNSPLNALPGVIGLLTVVGLMVARRRAAFAWWEFVVVGCALGVALFVPVAANSSLDSFNVDLRGRVMEAALGYLAPFAYPALLVAGAALAQIAVTASFAAVAAGVHLLPPRTAVWSAVVLLGSAGWQLVQWITHPESTGAGWLGSALTIAAVVLLLAGVLSLAGRAPAWSDLDEDSTKLNYLVAFGVMAYALVALPLSLVREGARFFGPGWLFAATDAVLTEGGSDAGLSVIRMIVAGTGLVLCLGAARRGRPWAAMFLASLTVLTAFTLFRSLGVQGWTDNTVDQMAAVLLGLVVAAGAWLGFRRRLTLLRTTALASALLLCVIFPHRSILDDPISAALGFSGIGAVLFGLVWRLLTEGSVTAVETPKWPVPARVLLYCANALLAVSSAAYVAASRSSGTYYDVAVFAELGDFLLGTPLFITAVLGCLAIALAPDRRVNVPNAAAAGMAAQPR